MSYKIISGTSQQFYHTIPSELDLITTTPTREGIFKYLSQIGYDEFPEFILDILIKVEGHKPVDVTDGQGDEKQDILTINPKGERCLTQCKHTVDYKSRYNGDDLDLLVAACMRKKCNQAILVTNSDLTPQGKKYVTDEEYNRGFKNPNDCPSIDYWNGFKIWDRIKNNQDIINKWFSGLGQVHGLRSFKFDLTIQELPFTNKIQNISDAFEELLKLLSTKSWIIEKSKGLHYKALISSDYDVNIKRWFQFTGRLDINFLLPEDDLNFINKPLYALTIEVVLKSKPEKYNPTLIREEIVKKISDKILINQINDKWWHLTTSQIKSIIYLHDITEPREIDLSSASTFVKPLSCLTQNELNYCSLSKSEFKLVENDEDSIWIHEKTGIQVVQMFKQQINPVEQYNYQLIQYNQLKEIASYNFYAVRNINSSMMMRVRRILNHDWIAFQYNDDAIIWAIEPNLEEHKIKIIHDKLNAINLKVLKVKSEDVKVMLENVQKDLAPSNWMFTSQISKISYPVMLNRRVFWLSKDLKINKSIDIKLASELLKYKYSFEKEFGYDNMQGKTEQQISSLELREILYEFFTIRGKRMLDIAIYNNHISINVRFAERSLESSNHLAIHYLSEFETVYDKINKILNYTLYFEREQNKAYC